MKNRRILVPCRSPAQEGERYTLEREALTGLAVEFVECLPDFDSIARHADRADAIYVRGTTVSREIIEYLSSCKAIVVASSGYDNVDIDAATEKGLPVVNCPDTFAEEVADHAMTLLLATHRRILDLDAKVRVGQWSEPRQDLLKVNRLRGQTLGIIGFGRIGRAVAVRAQAFGLQVVVNDPYLHEDVIIAAGAHPVALSEAIELSDFISLHVPATSETRELINDARLRSMKRTAILINTSRGSVVDERALTEALYLGRLAGAGLDVLEIEPPFSSNALLQAPNTLITPHCASASSRFETARKRRVGQELALVFRGFQPLSCVNPEVLYRTELRKRL
jgi:D-3-phosphoglycerate dehydrogenase / 2-oxoglutarate reductase